MQNINKKNFVTVIKGPKHCTKVACVDEHYVWVIDQTKEQGRTLLYRQGCFTGKYITRKIRTKQ